MTPFSVVSMARICVLLLVANSLLYIFTPLFLSSSIIIPAKEDIAHEKLSEWMREWEPTVTHLTPAMGNVLVAASTAKFPSLRHVFFGEPPPDL